MIFLVHCYRGGKKVIFKLLFLFALIICAVTFDLWHSRKCNESLAAIHALCDASEAFTDWRLRNQGVYIGLSEKGRMLLGRNLDAYDWYLRTHKFIDGKEHREWLVSLFYDFPPKHPRRLRPEIKKAA